MHPNPKIALKAKAVHIPDGDTIRVKVEFEVDVRLLGGDTPELKSKDLNQKAIALEAKREMYRLCYAEGENGEWGLPKEGILEIPITSDNISHLFTMGRVLGNFWVDGVNCMDNQLDKGLAKPRKGT